MSYNRILIVDYVWYVRTLVGGENFIFYFICNHFFPQRAYLFLHLGGKKIKILPLRKNRRKEGSFFPYTMVGLSLPIPDLRPWPDY